MDLFNRARIRRDGLIGLGFFILDRLVKWYALCHGTSLWSASLAGVRISWTLVYNYGAAWGVLSDSPTLLLLIRCACLAAIIVLYVISRPALLQMALIAIISGALSNIIDTLIWGKVIDMIHIQIFGFEYPVFNIADIAICLGTMWLFFSSFVREK